MAEEVGTKLFNMDLENKGEIENNESSEMQDEGDTGRGGKKDPPLPPGFARLSSALEDTHYKMTHKHIGYCVIFNHDTYDSGLKQTDRKGSDRDRDQMKDLFSDIGYDVKVYNNLTVQKLTNVLLERYYSWRNKTYGSWFVQSVVEIFRREHGHKDVVSMLTSVNRYMIANFKSSASQEDMNGKVQTAYYFSTLMRDVHLNKKN